jgi:copper chaperone CopZ
MFRRRFLQLAALSSTGAFAPLATLASTTSRTIIYRVKGFTCPTCAVGLDTLLQRQKGIVSSHSTYPDGKVTVSFHPDVVNDDAIRAFIAEMGFTVEAEHGA